MLVFLRAYLYWTVLWGLLAYPALPFRSLLPPLLIGIDVLMMLLAIVYVLMRLHILVNPRERSLVCASGFGLVAVCLYGMGTTYANGGSLLEGANYLAVLARPLLMLLALFIYTRGVVQPNAVRLWRTLRLDFRLLVAIQLSVACLQLIAPTTGAEFIPTLVESQSGIWALELGHVSGTFPNSIDLAYFLLAAYIALTQEAWQRHRMPSALLTALLGYFTYATGSATATICFGIYAGFLWLRVLSAKTRWLVLLFGLGAALALIYLNKGVVAELVSAKVEDMMLSRLGLIFISLPDILQITPLKLLTGLGADFTVIDSLLKSLEQVPLLFTYYDSISAINDVFWVALVLALGLPVMLLYVMSVSQLFSRYLSGLGIQTTWFTLSNMIMLLIFVAGLLNQILAVRSFTTALLIGLAPLAISAASNRTRRQADQSTFIPQSLTGTY